MVLDGADSQRGRSRGCGVGEGQVPIHGMGISVPELGMPVDGEDEDDGTAVFHVGDERWANVVLDECSTERMEIWADVGGQPVQMMRSGEEEGRPVYFR